jgi:SAM-dependent methyltransferase
MTNTTTEITSCEICGNLDLVPVLDLGLHPMCDDLVEVGDARVCREYPIDILFCKTCNTAHQRFQIPKAELFPSNYHYRSRFTADVLNGMRELVASCEEKFGALDGKTVLDIGCNDGSLLDFFREKGALTFGIEPTGAVADAQQKGHTAYEAFLDLEIATDFVAKHGRPDFITFTNVFAHIEDLNAVLDALRPLISPQTVLVIENHYLGSVLAGNQFDTFYHEHPRTYSYTSFVTIAKNLGVNINAVEFPKRYGGNIRMFLTASDIKAAPSGVDLEALKQTEAGFFDDFARLNAYAKDWQQTQHAALQALVAENGPLVAKAFPGRSAILVKLLGLNEDMVSVVYEKPTSMKNGHYLPGTRIPIRSEDELFALADKSQPILNLAWHISTEIRGYLAASGYTGPVIDVIDAIKSASQGK